MQLSDSHFCSHELLSRGHLESWEEEFDSAIIRHTFDLELHLDLILGIVPVLLISIPIVVNLLGSLRVLRRGGYTLESRLATTCCAVSITI